ncbi:CHAT domain-containing protein [Chitinophaga sp. sic0106]|uniref:CHAT domain-containing protein n=1 Tax=Chitinophaga sp. sic0106 TaxID=2854785 RepID=UPI001C438578|nr:CHAT domain-containing protein [Chitinophaga sp. sic0106]MBV7531953.1 CHAT domain-containing protein [Chitinophaga sp. sic0106]
MMRRQLMIICCLATYFHAGAQCPARQTLMQAVIAVEQSADDNNSKIHQLDSLLAIQKRCYKVKDSVYARIVHRMGNIYHLQQSWDNAIAYTKDAIAVNSTAKDRQEPFLVNSYFNLGLFYDKLYLYEESYHYFDSCILLGIRFPEKTAIALLAFERSAFSLYNNGQYQQAKNIAELGYRVAHSVRNSLSEIALMAQKAQAMVALEDTAAGGVIRQAIAMLTPTTPEVYKIVCYTVYAAVCGKLRQEKEAVRWYRQVLRWNEAAARWSDCARNTLDLGNFYLDIHQPAQAMQCYRQGVQFAIKSADPYVLAGVYNNIGSACWNLKKYREALVNYQLGLTTLPVNFKDPAITANPGYDRLRLVNNNYFVYTLLSNKAESLMEIYRSTGEQQWGKAALQTFMIADLSVDLMRWKQSGEPTQLYWRNRTRKMYAQAIEVSYLLQDANAACHFFEKSRAVLLNDKLNELGARRLLPAAAAAEEQQLRIRVNAMQQQLAMETAGTPAYEEASQQLFREEKGLERFIAGLEQRHPGYYRYKYDTSAATPALIRKQLLAADQELVSYFMADSLAYVLQVTVQGARLYKLPYVKKDVEDLLETMDQRAFTTTAYSRYRELSYKVYKQLFAPLQLPGKRVIISGDEYFIPFEALLTDTLAHNSYLLRKHAFSYTYAAGSLLKQQRAMGRAVYPFLGIAPVEYAADLQLQPLPGAAASVGRIRKDYNKGRVLTGTKANRDNFLEQLPRSSVVQLYTHASAAGTEPVLYLADTSLRLPEIGLLEDTVTALIILSSCESGTGKLARGEGVLSLGRAFSMAGIPAVITSLWKIDNNATYELTEKLHDALAHGMPKDIALQQAKLAYLDGQERDRQLPYYWASAVLIGDAAAVKGPAPKGFPYGYVLIGLFFLILVVVLLRKYF